MPSFALLLPTICLLRWVKIIGRWRLFSIIGVIIAWQIDFLVSYSADWQTINDNYLHPAITWVDTPRIVARMRAACLPVCAQKKSALYEMLDLAKLLLT